MDRLFGDNLFGAADDGLGAPFMPAAQPAQAAAPAGPTQLKGIVGAIMFQKPENGYTVFRLRTETDDTVTVTGTFLGLQEDAEITVTGEFTRHPKFGYQFKATRYEIHLPETPDGIEAYLGSGLISGIGPDMARRIVEAFGADTWRVIEQEPARLLEVPGIGEVRQQAILKEWEAHNSIRALMGHLAGYNIPSSLIIRVWKELGAGAIAVLEGNVYGLTSVSGFGFRTADKIARAQGIPFDAPERLRAGLNHALEEAGSRGHVYLPRQELIEEAVKLLTVKESGGEKAPDPVEVNRQADWPGVVVIERTDDGTEACYTPKGYQQETAIAASLRKRLATINSPVIQAAQGVGLLNSRGELTGGSGVTTAEKVNAVMENTQLTTEQLSGILNAIQYKISIITGGPGTGKTTTMKGLCAMLEWLGIEYMLAAPTGRASKRLSEASGKPAQTVHRLLGFGTESFGDGQLTEGKILIVDESSMLDQWLFHFLLKALPEECHLLLVGDADQLPSVGAGNVLRDLIASGAIPVTRLGYIFRQEDAQASRIVRNAHRINEGQPPIYEQCGDFYYFSRPGDGSSVSDLIVALVTNRIPGKFPYAAGDIQVLAPMHKGDGGVAELNARLQAALNPPAYHKAERTVGERVLRTGDRVMVTRNNYTLEVFNGDVGRITEIRRDGGMTVEIDGKLIAFDNADAEDVVLAYAATVHKSQGSEYPVVVLPILSNHYIMLARNLLYTGITRARKLLVLVGDKEAIAQAARNGKAAKRYTRLAERLGANASANSVAPF